MFTYGVVPRDVSNTIDLFQANGRFSPFTFSEFVDDAKREFEPVFLYS